MILNMFCIENLSFSLYYNNRRKQCFNEKREENRMNYTKEYFAFLQKKLEEAASTQEENIKLAADMIIESVYNAGSFYVFGSGHSHMVAEELYTRAGGLMFVKGILLPELMLHQSYIKSTYLERVSGYAEAIMEIYPICAKDTLLVISNSGRNNVPIEMCLEAQKRGAKVIALTSLRHSKAVSSRHVSGKRLFEIADLVLDNQAEIGDASFEIAGGDTPVAGISDFIGIAIAQAIVATTAAKIVEKGMQPPIFRSANVDISDEYWARVREFVENGRNIK